MMGTNSVQHCLSPTMRQIRELMMRRMSRIASDASLAAFAAVTLMFTAPAALATTVGFTLSRNSSLSVAPVSQTLSFPQFNPSQGTLTGAVFSYVPTLDGSLSASLISGETNDTMQSWMTSSLSIRFGAQALFSGNATASYECYVLGSGQSCGGSAAPEFGQHDFLPNPLTLTTPALLTAFTGLGTLSLVAAVDAFAVQGTSNTVVGSTWREGQLIWGGDVTLTYQFTAPPPSAPPVTDTPEPASLSLFGTGLALAGLARRRRRP